MSASTAKSGKLSPRMRQHYTLPISAVEIPPGGVIYNATDAPPSLRSLPAVLLRRLANAGAHQRRAGAGQDPRRTHLVPHLASFRAAGYARSGDPAKKMKIWCGAGAPARDFQNE